MGSNPSTESNHTTEITARNKIQVLCMRRQGTMESSTHKGAKELKHSSNNHRQRIVATGCVHSLTQRILFELQERLTRVDHSSRLFIQTQQLLAQYQSQLQCTTSRNTRNTSRNISNNGVSSSALRLTQRILFELQERLTRVDHSSRLFIQTQQLLAQYQSQLQCTTSRNTRNTSRNISNNGVSSSALLNHKEITLLFVYGSSDINIIHLPFFRSGKDPLEDLIYTSCTDPIQQPAAARTPRLYTSPRLCQSLVLCLFHSRITVLCSTADSADVKVADPSVVSTADPDFLLLQLEGKLEDLIYTSCTDPIQQPAAARTPRLYTSPRLCQSLALRLCEKGYKHRV
ncbi:hypothetical protein F511_09477 [Dorcoceras hygrometricum]|uniref:Uncharacterized protein n=1 Tax=Dorcoceras hygrometricum TaxID=472368 RepID=A0A2Z7A369_9LAMI|nr:hypothetical protein F511_09477 [Dorcoceras hygrometricum]